MEYEAFLWNISKHDKFEIVREKYEEAFFGDFQISLRFAGELDLEIINDRGIMEIFILHPGAFKKHQIPLWFVIGSLKDENMGEPPTLDSLMRLQEYLMDHVPLLLHVIEKNFLNEISRRWSRRRWMSRTKG